MLYNINTGKVFSCDQLIMDTQLQMMFLDIQMLGFKGATLVCICSSGDVGDVWLII